MILDSSAVAPVPAPTERGTHRTATSIPDGRTTQRNLNSATTRPAGPPKPRREEFIRIAALLRQLQEPQQEKSKLALRNEFYSQFLELTRREAFASLHARGNNDPAEEAKDIAQSRAIVLARQEQRGAGMFGKTSLGDEALEGYIRRAIARGAYRAVTTLARMRAQRGTAVPLDARSGDEGDLLLDIPVHGRNILMEISAKNLLARLKEKAERQRKRQPVGTTPIDWVLAQASGAAIQPPKGSTRTRQRRIAEVRALIQRGLAGQPSSL